MFVPFIPQRSSYIIAAFEAAIPADGKEREPQIEIAHLFADKARSEAEREDFHFDAADSGGDKMPELMYQDNDGDPDDTDEIFDHLGQKIAHMSSLLAKRTSRSRAIISSTVVGVKVQS